MTHIAKFFETKGEAFAFKIKGERNEMKWNLMRRDIGILKFYVKCGYLVRVLQKFKQNQQNKIIFKTPLFE